MTKREMFNEIRNAVIDNAEMVAFIDHEIELLSRKSGKKSETKVQKENKVTIEVIAEVLADADAPKTVSELIADERLAGFTNQKVSALLRKMIADERVVKTTEKKVSRFALA